jgi:diadenosine tetraphosphate (Ap4A) HIT family hydrolase
MKNKPIIMNLDNTRDPRQKSIMEDQLKNGVCHFCREGFETRHTAPIMYENKYWVIAANNFPYEGSTKHYLLISKRHVTKMTDLNKREWLGLLESTQWLENHLNVPAFSIFSRNGNMTYTGATLSHLHFQFLLGIPKPKNAKISDGILVTLGYKKK